MNRYPKILVADDDDDDAYFIGRAVLEVFPDFEYERVPNGSRLLLALERRSDNVAFVILDLNMPVLNGRDSLCAIKRNYGNKFPVFILSNSNHLHEKEFCMQHGADSCHIKPVSYEGYVSILKQMQDEYLDSEAVKVLSENKVKNKK